MIGAVIVAYRSIGKELIRTTEYIVGETRDILEVTIDWRMDSIEARRSISGAIKQTDQGDGVIILTGFFGGTPSNVAFSFLNRAKLEVITGVNLPMVLTYWNRRQNYGLAELAKLIQLSGTRSIVAARALMETKGVFETPTSDGNRRVSQK
jgi:PTS system mannose-specific IIA component